MGGALEKPSGDPIVVLPAERPGESAVVRHISCRDKLQSFPDEECTTLYIMFERTAKRVPKKNYLGWFVNETEIKYLTYEQARARSLNIGAGLRQLGLVPRKDFLGLYSINRPEWILSAHAADAHALALVPLYDTLGTDAVRFIIQQTDLKLVATSGLKIKELLGHAKNCPHLKYLISFDPPTAEQLAAAKEAGITILTLTELEELGSKHPIAVAAPKSDDIQTICYTSGTTGDPKGVLLTHENYLANVAGALVASQNSFNSEDVHISYLPLAHAFERILMNIVLYYGMTAVFYRGDAKKIFEDLTIIQPTFFGSVPRIWNKLYDKVMAAVNVGGVKQTLFETAYSAKAEALKDGYVTHAVYDALVFRKIRALLGGRVRMLLSGSAPISVPVNIFLRVCFSCPLLEGYGQTESSAIFTATQTWDLDVFGHVGFPIVCSEVKLVDVPDMNYLASDKPYPRGEICYRGPMSCKGYYKNDARTKELTDANGWYHSGDIGCFIEGGRLKIIDRLKNMFKLSIGEYVAPEKLENVFVQSQWVGQNFVYGDSFKSVVVAVVVPDFEVLVPWAQNKGKPTDHKALCADKEIIKMVLDDMAAKGRANGLKPFELAAAVTLIETPFSVDNDILTPTFKLKRPQAKKAFQAHIDEMYKDKE